MTHPGDKRINVTCTRAKKKQNKKPSFVYVLRTHFCKFVWTASLPVAARLDGSAVIGSIVNAVDGGACRRTHRLLLLLH